MTNRGPSIVVREVDNRQTAAAALRTGGLGCVIRKQAASSFDGPALRLLCVDDDCGWCLRIWKHFEKVGDVELTLTRSGVLATRLVSEMKHFFDAALIDVRLLDANGLDVCASLAAAFPDSVVVPWSGIYVAAEDMARALGRGVDEYCLKYEPLESIETRIRGRLIARRKRHEQICRPPFTIFKFERDVAVERLTQANATVVVYGRRVQLGNSELRLLAALLLSREPLGKGSLLKALGYSGPTDRREGIVASTTRRLREKLDEVLPGASQWIRTVGSGYQFAPVSGEFALPGAVSAPRSRRPSSANE